MSITASIKSWSIPEGEVWSLRILVLIQPFEVYEAYYRVHEFEQRTQTRLGKDEWNWFRWSGAGKPTVRVSPLCSELLNGLVVTHPDLSKLLYLFGLADAAN